MTKQAAKIPIDIRELFRSGRFDCVRIGQTKELILSNFPRPDGFREEDRASWLGDDVHIWVYGNIELHFEGALLRMIFSDHVDLLDGDGSLAIEPWILAMPDQLTLLEVMRALNREHIDFTKKTRHFAEMATQEVQLTLASGITLQFNRRDTGMRSFESADGPVEDQNELRLTCFSLTA